MLRTDSSKYVGALIEYLLSVVTAQAVPGRSLQSRGLSVHLGLTGSAPCAVVCRVRPAPPAARCATRSPRRLERAAAKNFGSGFRDAIRNQVDLFRRLHRAGPRGHNHFIAADP